MAVTDPRKLAVILRDLDDEMQRWSMKADDTLNAASYTQSITREATHQARRQALITTEQYYEDESVYQSRTQSVEDLLGKYVEAVRVAIVLVSDVETKLQVAQNTLKTWTDQLQQALAWRSRAETRVYNAQIALNNAISALDRANYALGQAAAAYENCRNRIIVERDRDGRIVSERQPDCGSEASAVANCQEEVRRCVRRVEEAQAELYAAQAELSRATARVNACEQAKLYAKQSVATAEASLGRAKNALAQADRALDHVKAAEQTVQHAGELVSEQLIKVEDMNVNMQTAEDFLSDAQGHLFSSTRYEESAQRYRIIARSELEHRIEVLYALNRPELLEGVSGGGRLLSGSAFGIGGVSSSGSRVANDKPRSNDVPMEKPIRFTHMSNQEFEIRVYPIGHGLNLRIYNVSRRNKIPDSMTDGDGTCIDIIFNEDQRGELKRFERREQGFDAEMLLLAENICREKNMKSIFLTLASKLVDALDKRDWFLSRNYQLDPDGDSIIITKSLDER